MEIEPIAYVEPENFIIKHRSGMLSMISSGCNSQCIILTSCCPHLDGRGAVFGRLIKGFSVLKTIEDVTVGDHYQPMCCVVIAHSGEISPGDEDGVLNFFEDGDWYPDSPSELLSRPYSIPSVIHIVESIKKISLAHTEEGDFKLAERKFRKALRYLEMCWEMPDIDEATIACLKHVKDQLEEVTKSMLLDSELDDIWFDVDDILSALSASESGTYQQGEVIKSMLLDSEPADTCFDVDDIGNNQKLEVSNVEDNNSDGGFRVNDNDYHFDLVIKNKKPFIGNFFEDLVESLGSSESESSGSSQSESSGSSQSESSDSSMNL